MIENGQTGANAENLGNFNQMAMGTPGVKILTFGGTATYSGDFHTIWAREDAVISATASNDGDSLVSESLSAGEMATYFGKDIVVESGKVWVYIR